MKKQLLPLINIKGKLLNIFGMYNKALKFYDRVIELYPDYAYAYCGKGNALYCLGEKEKAIEAYDHAIKFASDDRLIYYCAKGRVLNNLGREREALDCFNKAFEISKTDNFETNLRYVDIDYIKNTLSQDREALLQKLILNQIAEMQAQMEAFQKKIIELEENTIQTDERLEVLKKSKSAAEEMQQQINNIVGTIQNFANQDDVEKITSEMVRLSSDNQLTNDLLQFLEQDVKAIIEKQANTGSSTKAYIVANNELINHEDNCDVNELVLGGLMSVEPAEAPGG
ncbi:MAG TPA: tetratricopeptide repeat protein [Rickettsia endosymbiont of Omalisus fontisbellaquei]|nr:tetratricopeptide repeat protein [Rickettsia endosymbiont of Omalisus fontisbellaquei]